MIKVTSSQIQFYPPPYMISRFAAADAVIMLSLAQHQSTQFMSNFVLENHKGKPVGYKLALTHPYPPNHRGIIRDIQLEHSEDRIRSDVQRVMNEAWGKNPGRFPYHKQAWAFFDATFKYDKELHVCVQQTMLRTMHTMWLPTPLFYDDVSLMPERPQNASAWISTMVRDLSGILHGAELIYFQGYKAMDAYFDVKWFDGIKLMFQDYQVNMNPKMSLLQSIAERGLENTIAYCQPAYTSLLDFRKGPVV